MLVFATVQSSGVASADLHHFPGAISQGVKDFWLSKFPGDAPDGNYQPAPDAKADSSLENCMETGSCATDEYDAGANTRSKLAPETLDTGRLEHYPASQFRVRM